jgi:predicted enzyme related to lactoylglutathione lyase
VIYVDVTSVEEYAKKVNKNGGKILVQKIEVKEWNISFIMKIQKNRFVLREGSNLRERFIQYYTRIKL